jgi:hypothetical protein
MRNQYEDAKGTLNFLVRQIQLLQYQVMLEQTPYGEYRPEPPIAQRLYRADAFAVLRKTQDWLEGRGLNKNCSLAHEAAAFLMKKENFDAVMLLRHIVMEGDCYWAGLQDDNDPRNWHLLVARGMPDQGPDLRFALLADGRKYLGMINPRGDIVRQSESYAAYPLVWKQDAGSIEGWMYDAPGLGRMAESKRLELEAPNALTA